MSIAGIILFMRLANERQRYIVTSSLIGWVHTQQNEINTYHGNQGLNGFWSSFNGLSIVP